MASIHPLPGWRYDPGVVDYAEVVTPPYDVISPAMQDELYAKNPHNAVRIIFGREQDDDNEQNNKYTRAATCLDAWREEKVFIQDKPSVYLYEQSFSDGETSYTRRGFFCRVLLSEWGEDGVYPHEKTLAGPKVDRLNAMRAVRGNPGPVFGLLTDSEGAISECLKTLVAYEPVMDIKDHDEVRNQMWVVDQPETIEKLTSLTVSEQVFIADGHHRYETAIAYRNEVREKIQAAGQTPPPLGELDSDYVLMLVVAESDPGLVIWPTHRLVHDVANFSAVDLLTRAAEHFSLKKMPDQAALAKALKAATVPALGIVLPDSFHLATLKDLAVMETRAPDAPEAWQTLDVSVLHLLILEDLLGIDEGKLLRKENIIYSRSLAESVHLAQSGEQGVQVGFLMRDEATTMAQVRAVASAGAVMPQKSTYFYPKVLSGLVFHLFW